MTTELPPKIKIVRLYITWTYCSCQNLRKRHLNSLKVQNPICPQRHIKSTTNHIRLGMRWDGCSWKSALNNSSAVLSTPLTFDLRPSSPKVEFCGYRYVHGTRLLNPIVLGPVGRLLAYLVKKCIWWRFRRTSLSRPPRDHRVDLFTDHSTIATFAFTSFSMLLDQIGMFLTRVPVFPILRSHTSMSESRCMVCRVPFSHSASPYPNMHIETFVRR